MRVKVYNQDAEEIGTTTLPSDIFGVKVKPDVLHQVIVAMEANRRIARAHTKGRGEVSGGGRKPWRQKGTGRARHGSIRSPIWRHGGVSHGPTKEKIFAKKINKKLRRLALRMALSSKVHDGEFFVVDSLKLSQIKTKEALKILHAFFKLKPEFKKPSVLFVTTPEERSIHQATRNISFAATIGVLSLNAWDILAHKLLFISQDAMKILQSHWSFGKKS